MRSSILLGLLLVVALQGCALIEKQRYCESLPFGPERRQCMEEVQMGWQRLQGTPNSQPSYQQQSPMPQIRSTTCLPTGPGITCQSF